MDEGLIKQYISSLLVNMLVSRHLNYFPGGLSGEFKYVYFIINKPVIYGTALKNISDELDKMFIEDGCSIIKHMPDLQLIYISNKMLDKNKLSKFKLLSKSMVTYKKIDIKKIIDGEDNYDIPQIISSDREALINSSTYAILKRGY